jgi:ribosomal small subunit protein bTHX
LCLKITNKTRIIFNFGVFKKRSNKFNKPVTMGKGDKKTRRGKIIRGTFGVRRRRKKTPKPELKLASPVVEKETTDKKLIKDKKKAPEVKEQAGIPEVTDAKTVKDGIEPADSTPVKKSKPVKAAAEGKEKKAPREKKEAKIPKEVKEKKEAKPKKGEE